MELWLYNDLMRQDGSKNAGRRPDTWLKVLSPTTPVVEPFMED